MKNTRPKKRNVRASAARDQKLEGKLTALETRWVALEERVAVLERQPRGRPGDGA